MLNKKNTREASNSKIRLSFLFLFFTSFSLFSQEKLVNGVIIIDLDDASPEGIFVTNSRTELTSITDITGSFALHARAGDSLIIRSDFYETRKFYLTEHLMQKDLLKIHLNLQPVVLDEAVITQKLTGFLDKDAHYNPGKDQIADLYKELGVNPDASKLRDSSDFTMWKDVSPVSLNVEKLLEVFNGDLRRRQNLYQFEGTEAVIENIRNYFGDEYFTEDLGIPKEKIREFIFFTYESTSIRNDYEAGNFLKIMQVFSKTAPLYLNRLKSWNAPIKDRIETHLK
jgi:hypothetical protein